MDAGVNNSLGLRSKPTAQNGTEAIFGKVKIARGRSKAAR
jgi:hypothetical protein